VNKLNTLYVGFTRAGDELYVVAVSKGGRDQFPIDLLRGIDGFSDWMEEPFRAAVLLKRIEKNGALLSTCPDPIPFAALEELIRGEAERRFYHRVLYFVEAWMRTPESELDPDHQAGER